MLSFQRVTFSKQQWDSHTSSVCVLRMKLLLKLSRLLDRRPEFDLATSTIDSG